MMNKVGLSLLFILILSGCRKEKNTEPDYYQSIRQYLTPIIDVMQNNSAYRKSIDWNDFRKQVFDKADSAGRDVAIRTALTLLMDSCHSSFKTKTGLLLVGYRNFDSSFYFADVVNPDSEIGYVKVPAFGQQDYVSSTQFISSIQQIIRQQDHVGIKGWIIDLRGNSGGYYWPMLLSIGSVLGEGLAGYTVDADGNGTPWGYYENEFTSYMTVPPYRLIKPNPKIAVLTDWKTASAAEQITISFKGRPNTKSFGTPTRGVATKREYFNINDELLTLSTEVMADRAKNLYKKSVVPDVVQTNSTLAIQAAVEWLKQ